MRVLLLSSSIQLFAAGLESPDLKNVRNVAAVGAGALTANYIYKRNKQRPHNVPFLSVDPIPYVPESISNALLAVDDATLGIVPLLQAARNQHQGLDKTVDQFNKVGKTFATMAAGVPVVIMTKDPVNVEWMLAKNFANYKKGTFAREVLSDLLGQGKDLHKRQWSSPLMTDLLGKGIFAIDGELWKEQRKIASRAFTQRIFGTTMFTTMDHHAKAVENLLMEKQGQQVDFFGIMNRFTLDSIGEIGFGQNLDTLSNYPDSHPFLISFDRAQSTTHLRSTRPLWRLNKMFNYGIEGQMKDDVRMLRNHGMAVVKDMKTRFAENGPGGDFLSLFLSEARKANKTVDDNFLVDVCLNFVIAGRDTTACALSWMFFELTQHPEVLARARKEIADVLGEDGELKFQDLNKFEYLRAIQDETLRLHPSVPRDFRTAMEDDTLPDGTQLKEGTIMGYHPYAMGRCQEIWGQDCQTFRPERWEETDYRGRPDFHYIFPVFHAGPRRCLGFKMAYQEMTVLMVQLLPKFDFVLTKNPEEVQVAPTLTLAVKDGLPLKFSPRK